MAAAKRAATVLLVLSLLCAIGSALAAVASMPYKEKARAAIEEATSIDQISDARNLPAAITARRLNTLSTVLGVAFVVLLIAGLVARKANAGPSPGLVP